MTTWHKGPPPSVGWWPASYWRDPRMYRWWNGERWSTACTSDDSAEEAAEKAGYESFMDKDDIAWTDRPASWPERSKT
jgi:hypothetical protein